MAGLGRRTNKVLSSLVPEKRLFIQSGAATRYIRITPLAQLGIGASALVVGGWLMFASSVAVVEMVASSDRADQLRVLQDAYAARMQELVTERDRSAEDARATQDRFRLAMEQIGRQQTALLEEVEERRELAAALDLMRSRLASEAGQEAGADLPVAAGPALAAMDPERAAGGDHLARTLDTISAALADTVVERDAAEADRAVLAGAVADLELRLQMNARSQDEMLGQLEQAVAMSFAPLNEMFGDSGVDVDELIETVRGGYSGVGGPLGEATMSSRSVTDGGEDGGIGTRMNAVMLDLDRMNLMRIAAGRVPYAMPVSSAFRFTSGYGYRRDPKGAGRRLHRGIDLAAPRGTPIYATADGVITSARSESGYGNTVRIQHDFGFETVYAHQSRIRVQPGQQVSRGERIGDMGSTGRSTGVHLHYEVHLNGQPVNPMTYLEAARNVF